MAKGRYDVSSEVIEGQALQERAPALQNSAQRYITVPATTGNPLELTEEVACKHILSMGSIGSGKTNCMFHILRAIVAALRRIDRMIIFDAKGDYEEEFRTEGDIVIGGASGRSEEIWNIFADLMDSPNEAPDMQLLRQLATTLFDKQIKTSNNPAFPSGARDLFVGLTLAFIRREQRKGTASWATLNNRTLKRFFANEVSDPARIAELIAEHPDLKWLKMYILSPQSATTQSYLAPLQAVVNEMFIGCFEQAGSFSIRKYIVSGGTGKVFISYDAEYGCMMDAIYTVLLDMAMRQAIGRSARNGGSIFFSLDELPMLPALTYLDQCLNFGRSLGVKVIAGIQNSSQMDEKYGEARAASVLSGFSTYLCFHLFDEKSRILVKERHGKNLKRISCMQLNGQNDTEVLQQFDVIEDWDITQLDKGRCIVSLPEGEPFRFHPLKYEPKKKDGQKKPTSNFHITLVRKK